MTLTYDPTVPAERQLQSWTCSVRTATFMLKSLGIDIDAARMQDVLVPDYVTPELGLLAGDGSGLAAVLADQSGCPTGHTQASWAWLQENAGNVPIGMGSGTLYHWLAVRDLNPDGSLALANPAPGYRGVYDVMTEAQFRQWAPWSAVWIEVEEELAPPGEVEEDPAMIEELTAQLAEAQRKYDELNNYSSHAFNVLLPSWATTLDQATIETGKQGWAKVKRVVTEMDTELGIKPGTGS